MSEGQKAYEGYEYQEGEEYEARPKGMMYFESKDKGTPCFQIAFGVETEAGVKRLDAKLWLSDKAKDRSMETLTHVLKFNGNFETDAKGVFIDENIFPADHSVKVTVKYNDRGYPEIQWINSLGGAKFAGANPVQAKSGMDRLGLKAMFLSLNRNQPTQPKPAPKKDVPF